MDKFQNIKKIWTWLWCLFIIFSWSFFAFIIILKFNPLWNILIIIFGIFFFYLKLKIDGLNILKNDINLKLIFYYLFCYLNYFLIGSCISYYIYSEYKNGSVFWKEILKDYKTEKLLYFHYLKYTLSISNLFIVTEIQLNSSSLNYFFKDIFKVYNNNLGWKHIIYIIISLNWWFLTDFVVVNIFIIVITFATLPEWVERKLIIFRFKLKKKNINYEDYKRDIKIFEKIQEEQQKINNIDFENQMLILKKTNIYKWYFSKIFQIFGIFLFTSIWFIIIFCSFLLLDCFIIIKLFNFINTI